MRLRKNMNNGKITDKLVTLLFIICAVIFVAYPMHSGYIFSGSDMQFHLSRIYEIKNGLEHLKYPWVSFLTFNKIGYAINSFYPNGSLLVFIPLFILIKNPVTAYYTFMGTLFFGGANCQTKCNGLSKNTSYGVS